MDKYDHYLLQYPTVREVKGIVIDLEDVRASDGIRVSYDFERDGWVIEQPTIFEWGVKDDQDEGYVEVAFVKSWQLEE